MDSLTYDELYEMFGGNPTPAAITKEEARLLPSKEYAEDTKEKNRSDMLSCPICLQVVLWQFDEWLCGFLQSENPRLLDHFQMIGVSTLPI